MGDTGLLRSCSDDVVPFVDAAEQHLAEVDRPDAVGDLFEADGMLLERVRDEEQALLEVDGAGIGDAFHDELPGVLERRQGARVRAGGGTVERRRCLSLEGLVGALVVVEVAEVVERALLARQCCPGRTDRL